jgi:hypothetical protein
VVLAPAVGDVEGAPSGDDRPALEHFLDQGDDARGWPEAVVWADALGACGPPIEEPAPPPSGLPGPSFGPAMKPSSEIERPTTTLPLFVLLISSPLLHHYGRLWNRE